MSPTPHPLPLSFLSPPSLSPSPPSLLSLPPSLPPFLSLRPSLPLSPSPPSLSLSVDNVSKTLELALKYRSRGVVGVDMAGDELLPLDPQHVQGFLNAKAKGLHITVHAGESGPAANVRQVYTCTALTHHRNHGHPTQGLISITRSL